MPLIELIEKKNKPIMTRFKFSKKEYNMLTFAKRAEYSKLYEVHETARTVYFDVEGDLLNPSKAQVKLLSIYRKL